MLYKRILEENAFELSSFLNQKSETYGKKISQLQELISHGKTDGDVVDTLNQIMVEQLQSLGKYSKVEIEVKKSPEEFEKLKTALQSLVSQLTSEDSILEDTSANAQLKEEILNTYEKGMFDILSNKLIEVKIESQEFPIEVVSEYIDNYFKLSKPSGQQVVFSEATLAKYLNYLESQIQPDEESLQIQEEIVSFIKGQIKSVSLAITSDQMFIDSYHSFLSDVEAFFGWIAQEELSDDLKMSLSVFKNNLKKRVIDLAVKANMEVFPNLLESKIRQKQEEEEGVISKLTEVLSFLEEERREVFSVLNQEKLDLYLNYAPVQSLITAAVSHKDAFLSSEMIFNPAKTGCLLKPFLQKRNEQELVIKKQIEDKEESYSFVKAEIEKLEENNEDAFIAYFINSVKLFQEELETSILGDLSLNFEEVFDLSSEVHAIKNKTQAEISSIVRMEKDLKTKEKQRSVNQVALNQYQFPHSLAQEFVSETSDFEEKDIDALTREIKEFLSTLNDQELFPGSDVDQDYLADLASLKGSKNIGELVSVMDATKEILSSDELKSAIKDIPVLGTVVSVGLSTYSLGKIYKEAKNSGKVKEEEINSLKVKITSQIATNLVKQALKA